MYWSLQEPPLFQAVNCGKKNKEKIGQETAAEALRETAAKNRLGADLGSMIGTLSKDDDGSENVFLKKMNLRSFKLNRVYLDALNMSNAGDFSWS